MNTGAAKKLNRRWLRGGSHFAGRRESGADKAPGPTASGRFIGQRVGGTEKRVVLYGIKVRGSGEREGLRGLDCGGPFPGGQGATRKKGPSPTATLGGPHQSKPPH